MKRILITGAASYIGTSVARYLLEYNRKQKKELYQADTISLRDPSWEMADFSQYDAIYHVAGIAHVDTGKVTEEEKQKYYDVNRDLTIRVAEKAKKEGVGQFIFMSSIIVYGAIAYVGHQKYIRKDTAACPENFYGDSKLQAENGLQKLADASFRVAILRPPMIYGAGAKGNYALLTRFAGRIPAFPDYKEERSVLYVENLAEFVRLLVESGRGGVFFPQNKEYAATSQLLELIREAEGKKTVRSSFLNPFVRLGALMPGKLGILVNKAFGSVLIDRELSDKDFTGYQLYSLRESILKSQTMQEKEKNQ